ncbi:hypothetical protein ASC89_19640 [Devosia sp. Root413D1]|uniref:hypothetical protein n=1 Tax=unclassified Devosia TaxID=196773 RepID=UPI0006F99AE1|nr:MULTISPECIES: hypothetical protein [unclassified Devosia]KQU97500.1 hypothetical protein ASC68_11925 [Devosia sp. Root105]KQW77397.1 hypothetical protein ASC89_19640 [Devosia sp. Root413D1]
MRLALAFAALLLAAAPATAQSLTGVGVEGNWGCRANVDGARAGLLTIYAGSYGYASANFGSTASGSGTVEMASNGVTFLDGNLVAGAGITNAILGFDDAGRDVLQLYTAEKNVLTCTPRG